MIVLTTALALLAAAPDGAAIKVGVYAPFSGPSASMGLAVRNGARLAAEEVNAAGGVLGKKIVLVEVDDEAKPEKGPQIVKDLVEKEGVAVLLGPANTGVANTSTGLANQRKIPHVVPVATGNKVNELFAEFPQNYVFRLAASDAVQASMIVTQACAARGHVKPAILSDETAYGQQGRARLEALLERRGLKPAYLGTLKMGEKDMSGHVRAARAAGADVILLYALGAEAAAVARGLEAAQWKVELIGTWILSSPAFVQGAGPYGEGTVMPQTFIEAGAAEPQQLHFIEAYRQRNAVARIETAPAAAQAYDALHLIALALKQAGTADGPQLKAALEDLKASYQGATGEYVAPWRPDDHEAVTPANVVWGMVKGGAVLPYDGGAGGGGR